MYINLLNHRSFLKAAAAVAITAVPFSASVYAANNDDESSSRSFLFSRKRINTQHNLTPHHPRLRRNMMIFTQETQWYQMAYSR